MSTLPKYYFRDIPAYLMDEIITGMIEDGADALFEGGMPPSFPMANRHPHQDCHHAVLLRRNKTFPLTFGFPGRRIRSNSPLRRAVPNRIGAQHPLRRNVVHGDLLGNPG